MIRTANWRQLLGFVAKPCAKLCAGDPCRARLKMNPGDLGGDPPRNTGARTDCWGDIPQLPRIPVTWKNQCYTPLIFLIALTACQPRMAPAQVAIRGKTVHTMAGKPIENAVLVIKDGKIAAIGKADDVKIPDGFETLEAAVVTPGLVDARATVGLTGILNQKQDQDQLERSEPIQPALRAIDAYNCHDELIAWVRGYGVTTVHTGHAPGELVSGQTMIAKTVGNVVEDAVMVQARAVAVTLASSARKTEDKSPGTRGKMMSMLRSQFIKAREYVAKRNARNEEGDPAERDLSLETLAQILDGKLALMITAERAQDIANALRLEKEFNIKVWLDGGAESYLLVDEIKAAGVPVILHPTMARATGDRENLSFETAATLVAADIPVALQSGYESYVPKTRVVLFEAALAAANGLSFEQALGTITIEAARILGIDDRVGSLEIGKDGDVALFDGDPFQYTSHCIAVVIDGQIVSKEKR